MERLHQHLKEKQPDFCFYFSFTINNYLTYKCETVRIKIIINEENYTSKCDVLALEEVKKHKNTKAKESKEDCFSPLLINF